MAFSSLFTLLDDIAAVLDDVSIMTKIAAKKTTGVIGDDLALNANQVSGKNILPEQELPIVWAVAKGSILNKAILIPLALLLSIYLPQAITVLLIIGGVYLCFEGVEKLLHKFLHHAENAEDENSVSKEDKIKGAIRTDFILIALGVLQESNTITKILSLSAVGIGITVFVYGFVGLIVKLDDIGLWLMKKKGSLSQFIGRSLLFIMPWFMKSLSMIGTIAMFLVGGGIFSHNVPGIHHWIEHFMVPLSFSSVIDFVIGIIVGTIACVVILPTMKLFSKK